MTEASKLPAGDFSSWLRHARSALLVESGTDVDCGECTACCSSSYFIHIRPEETRTLARINPALLAAAPGLPKGHVLLGYDKNGVCPLLIKSQCSIYAQRPHTCRNYDCRIFAAAGIAAGDDDKARINQRVQRWRFSYPTARDQAEHVAVQAAAKFIRAHAEYFPGGKIPSNPSQLAILAIKAYEVFLKNDAGSVKAGRVSSDRDIAKAIVDTCRKFDAQQPAPAQ